ncbi:MAG: 3-isopropylmalate/(R)-2-methylmalate dehydratase small subunit [Vicingaceae bacterium]|jgi:3-isopropylmalate/(R)-2-methylmalate dehydratase small subunit
MKTIQSTGVVLAIDNIDTDQIIPAKFLKSTEKSGFGKHLFANWRYKKDGDPNPDFALNMDQHNSSILITGNNFGCGSSREHAAWAISDYGIKAIISSQFADIFKGNALNNDILPIALKSEDISLLMHQITQNPKTKIEININQQTVKIDESNFSFNKGFEIDPLKKKFIVEGIGDLEFLLSIQKEIETFEKSHVV